MSRRIDWAGLMRVGLHGLGLTPDAFWRLTPAELRIMLGARAVAPPLTRARLAELAAAFPDIQREHGDDGRGIRGADRSAGGDVGIGGGDGRGI